MAFGVATAILMPVQAGDIDWPIEGAREMAKKEFDRWLAAEKAEAWEEGVRDERLTSDYAVGRQADPENPYRRNEGENDAAV